MDGVDLPVFDWYDLQPFRAFRAEMMRNNLAVWGPPPQEVSESYEKIELRDGYQSSLKLFKPTKHPTGGSPLIVLIHGGGFVMGSPEQLIPYGRALCKIFGATVVALSYRLAPEYKFPTQINDGWDTVQWCASNAESKLGADLSAGFIVGGVSAGGNLSAVIAQNSLEQKLAHPLTGIWLSVPVIFPAKEWVPEKYHDVYFSHEQNKDAPLLDAKAVKAVEDHLQPDNHSKWFSPYNAKNPHTGLPKTLIQVDGLDPLRDDGLVHEHVLKEHGVETRLDIWCVYLYVL